jgi:hypothetical protein
MCEAGKCFGSFTFHYKHAVTIFQQNREKNVRGGGTVRDKRAELESKRKMKYNKGHVTLCYHIQFLSRRHCCLIKKKNGVYNPLI